MRVADDAHQVYRDAAEREGKALGAIVKELLDAWSGRTPQKAEGGGSRRGKGGSSGSSGSPVQIRPGSPPSTTRRSSPAAPLASPDPGPGPSRSTSAAPAAAGAKHLHRKVGQGRVVAYRMGNPVREWTCECGDRLR